MLYRLPFLFSASFYLVLICVEMLVIVFKYSFFDSYYFFYLISDMIISELTLFFFIFILTNLFFYQNKLYFYTSKNKRYIILLAIILAIIYCVLNYFLNKLASAFLFPYLVKNMQLYHSYDIHNYYQMLSKVITIVTKMWLFIIIGIVLYCMVKWCRQFFQTPLIDNMTHSYQNQFIDSAHQLNSGTSEQDHRSLYAIVFASIFCCVSSGIIWNIYFRLLSSIRELGMMLSEYYYIIFFSVLVLTIINYTFLVIVSKKFIIKTYSWIPVSSLLTASAITLFLFGLCALIISCFMLPFVFALQSIILFVIWLVICYAMLYFFSRFSLRRYFA